nr:MAG TPA: hypothetical protein [Caudoviricetes sp.]
MKTILNILSIASVFMIEWSIAYLFCRYTVGSIILFFNKNMTTKLSIILAILTLGLVIGLCRFSPLY